MIPTKTKTFYFTASRRNLRNVEAEFQKLILTAPAEQAPSNHVVKYIVGKLNGLAKVTIERQENEEYHGFVTFLKELPIEAGNYYRQTIAHYCERLFPFWMGDGTYVYDSPSDIEKPEFIYGYERCRRS